MESTSSTLINDLAALAEAGTCIPITEYPGHLEEWRGRWHGQTPLIVAPKSVAELSRLMSFAYANDIAMVPQGGNTGLVGAQIPNGEVLITLKRLREVRAVAADDFAMTLEAGVTLSEAQKVATDADRLFPLSIGSEGTCQIGGVLSSNAGGVNVIRYGNARDLVLGLEAVLPNGDIWNGLTRLRKNNVGYDLKHLFIGGEGTLGVITAATLKLFPRPVDTLTAFVALPSAAAGVALLSRAQEASGGQVASFELMSAATLELIHNAFPALPRPLKTDGPYCCLIEFTSGQKDQLADLAAGFLERALADGIIVDGTIAQSLPQAEALWAIRHNASAAMKHDTSYCVKCDVSVPIGAIPDFLQAADHAIAKAAPGARVIAFGHMGDGNIHYDILGPQQGDDADWRARSSEMERLVHDVVVSLDGSISAEHGIGILKRDELRERQDPVHRAMALNIKTALDPKGLMNPGKLLAPFSPELP